MGLNFMLAGCIAPTDQSAGVPPDELTWWPTRAVPQPVKDVESEGRYWWPVERGEETATLWGNRGYVYVLRSEGEYPAEPPETTVLPRELKSVEALQLYDIHFHYDSAVLTPAAEEMMMDAVAKLTANPDASVTLEGHACSCGSRSYNLSLGLGRADAVMNFLISNGISADRVKTVSYGEQRPAVETEEVEKCILLPVNSPIRQAHSKNRRVEFRLTMSE